MSRLSSRHVAAAETHRFCLQVFCFPQIPKTIEGNITQFQSAVPNLSVLASVFHHTAAFIGHGWCLQTYLVTQRVYRLVIMSDRELSDVKQTRGTAGQNTFLNYFIHLYFDNLPLQKSSDLAMVGVSDWFPFFLLNGSSRSIHLNEGWEYKSLPLFASRSFFHYGGAQLPRTTEGKPHP